MVTTWAVAPGGTLADRDMADEPRYADDEVAEILDRASTAGATPPGALAPTDGLTLGELQEIGREAGLDPERLLHAARAVEARRGAPPRGSFLGMPTSVGRAVELPRALTDREWETFLGHVRDTFGAPGEVGSQGGAREWRNGNLRVLLEPGEHGHRLRLSTSNRRLTFAARAGVFHLAVGLVVLVLLLPDLLATAGFDLETLVELLPTLVVLGAGTGLLGWARIDLPEWAIERETQMEALAARALELAGHPPREE